MRDYMVRRGHGAWRPVADLPTLDLHDILASIADGYGGTGTQCTADQMAERIRIELVARAMGVGGNCNA